MPATRALEPKPEAQALLPNGFLVKKLQQASVYASLLQPGILVDLLLECIGLDRCKTNVWNLRHASEKS